MPEMELERFINTGLYNAMLKSPNVALSAEKSSSEELLSEVLQEECSLVTDDSI